jgi:DNA polymerase I-like protein with 3'-5' exonuclease and polymerase domains
MKLLFDIETDGFLDVLTKVHCIVIHEPGTESWESFGPDEIEDALEKLAQSDVLIGHNIARFDLPALQKVYPSFKYGGQVVDTQVLSRLCWPDIEPVGFENEETGKKDWEVHSLRAWGHRLGTAKGDFGKTTDWQEFTPEMLDYCEQDVWVNLALWEKLEEQQIKPEASELEHQFAEAIYGMIDTGVYFDKKAAEKLEMDLNLRKTEVFEKCRDLFPGTQTEMKTPQYWLDPETGTFYQTKSKAPSKVKARLQRGPNKIKTVPFNPSSRQEIIRNLTALGWEPQEFTDAGQPKLDDNVLRGLDLGMDLSALADLFMLDKRLGFLATGEQALLGRCAEDSRIHGWVNHNGTPTARCRHSRPNLGQVPSLRSEYGKEFRSLFTVPKGYKLVGCDADRLELVIMAHYMAYYDGGAYAKEVASGDIHTANQKAAGLTTRDQAKTFIYALNYGAGDEKLGTIKGAPKGKEARRIGANLRSRFMQGIPAYKRLIDDVKAGYKHRGFLFGLDGRRINVRSEHRAINALFQAGGAVVMKKATALAADHDLDARMVLHVHDEFQWEVREDHAPEFAASLERSITDAALALGLQCPLNGTAAIGDNWAETH